MAGGRSSRTGERHRGQEGEFISIVGASGCGKSTFLRLLLAQEQPDHAARSASTDAPPAVEPGRDRGIVFQRYSVFPHMTRASTIMVAGDGPSGRRSWGRLSGDRERQTARERAARRRWSGSGSATWRDQYPAERCRAGCCSGWRSGRRWLAKPKHPAAGRAVRRARPGHPGVDARLPDRTCATETRMSRCSWSRTTWKKAFKLGDRVLAFDKPRNGTPTDPQTPLARRSPMISTPATTAFPFQTP
jgi:NitT/TauT family transport system ATP-binding protein